MADRPHPSSLLHRAVFPALWLAVLVYVVTDLLGVAPAVRAWIAPAVFATVGALIGLRAWRGPGDRAAWALLASGTLLCAAGTAFYARSEQPDSAALPWVTHAGWLAFYVLAYAAMVTLLQARMRTLGITVALDALVGALTLAAIASALLLGAIDEADGLTDVDGLLGIAYIGGDVLLLACVVWGGWLVGRARARMWLLLGAAMALILAGDLLVDLGTLAGDFERANVFRALFFAGMIVLAAAAWQPEVHARRPRFDSLAVLAGPGACVVAALTLQALDHAVALPAATKALTLGVIAIAFVRGAVTYRQLKLLEEGRRYLRGFEDTAIGMAITTPEDEWLRVNAAFAAMVGRTQDELLGRPVLEVVHPDEHVETEAVRDAAISGAAQSGFPRRFVRPDGSVVEAVCTTVYVDEDGRRPYLYSQIQDVTERNRAARHSTALAELGRLAIEVQDPVLLVERAMPVVAAAARARRCRVLRASDAAPDGSLHVPLRRRHEPGGSVLAAELDGPGDETDLRFLQAVADVLAGALDRAAVEAETRRRALHDPLTGLANRTFLAAHVEQQLAAAGVPDGALSLLLLDVDRFKMVNDTLGHTTGDDLLRQVARRLREQTRRGDLVARLGGDEFVVACRHAGEDAAGEASVLAGRIVAAFERPFVVAGREIVLGASVGVAISDRHAMTAEALLRNADVAMYRAKDEGGGRHVLFDATLRAGLVQRLTLETALRRALEHDELLLHYQPLMPLETGRPSGFEALVRWRHPEHGLVPPADFIPIAEETGLIVPIGAWVLDEACRRCAGWNAARPGDPLKVGVNLSAAQLTPALAGTVRATLARHRLPPDRLVLELTETLLVERDSAAEVLAGLRSLGVSLALDDFGTGYSSLSYVSDYAIDYVKLDRSLIARIATSARDRALVRGAVEMADALGITVVAEGIEDEAQARAARELGCRLGQGWYWSKALDADAATRLALAAAPPLSPAG